MKKIFTLFAAVLLFGTATVKADCQDGPYGLQINGSTVVDAPKFGDADQQGRVQYKASCVSLKVGDVIKLINQSCDATWMVNIDPYGEYQSFEGGKDAGQLTCKKEGSYDFYIKMKQNDDLLYIGPGENCGTNPGTDPGTNPGTDPGTNPGSTGLEESGEEHIFALMGSIGGDWNVTEIKDEYTFDDRGRWSGTLQEHPQKPGKSYVIITDELGNQYKTKGWQGEDAKKVTLYWANGFEDSNVWQLPTGQTLYIIMRKCVYKGSIEVELVDQATYNAYTIDWDSWNANAVENTTVRTNITKTIENGQVVIIKNGVRYNLLGAQLQ